MVGISPLCMFRRLTFFSRSWLFRGPSWQARSHGFLLHRVGAQSYGVCASRTTSLVILSWIHRSAQYRYGQAVQNGGSERTATVTLWFDGRTIACWCHD